MIYAGKIDIFGSNDGDGVENLSLEQTIITQIDLPKDVQFRKAVAHKL